MIFVPVSSLRSITLPLFLSLVFLVVIGFSPSLYAQSFVKGNLIIKMIEGGGNAAQYGYVSVGEAPGRTQGKSCPRTALGNLPVGITECSTTYGSPVSTEWQPGDLVTATVPFGTSTQIPSSVRPPDAGSCVWKFEGFSGACTGMGTFDPVRRVHQCQFFLPQSGDIELGVTISGFDNLNRPCPVLINQFPTTPTASPTTTPTVAPTPTGDDIVSALGDAATQLADGLRIRTIIRGIVLSNFLPRTPGFSYSVSSNVTATGSTSNASLERKKKKKKKKKKGKIESFDTSVVLMRGSAKTSETKETKFRAKTTKAGTKLLNKLAKGTSFTVEVTVEASLNGVSVGSATEARILTK